MYELIILSLLIRWPIHGYLIVKIINDQIGPWAKLSSGTLYTILNRLEQTGLIAAMPQEQGSNHSQGGHRSRTFMITEEGRKRFHQLMMDTSSNLGDYQKFFYYKSGYLDLLRPNERLLLINHYLNYCQAIILHTQTERESLLHELAEHPTPAYLENLQRLLKHVEQNWQAEFEWIRGIREEELAKIDASQPGKSQQDNI